MFVISAVGSEKPEADIYQHALAQLPVAPEEVVYVDDVLDNVRTAVGLGMTGYVIDRLGTTPRQPDLDYVTDLFELLDVLGLRWAP